MKYFVNTPIALIYAYTSSNYDYRNHYYIISDEPINLPSQSVNIKIAKALKIKYSIINFTNAKEILESFDEKLSITIEQKLISFFLQNKFQKKFVNVDIVIYASDFLLAYSKIPKWPIGFRATYFSKQFRETLSSICVQNFITPPFQLEFSKFAGKKVLNINPEKFFWVCQKILNSHYLEKFRINLHQEHGKNLIFVNIYDGVLNETDLINLKKFVESIVISTKKSCQIILKLHPSFRVSVEDLLYFRNQLDMLGFEISILEDDVEFHFLPIELLLTSPCKNYYFGPLSGGTISIDRRNCFFTYPQDRRYRIFLIITYSQFLRRWQGKKFVWTYSSLIS